MYTVPMHTGTSRFTKIITFTLGALFLLLCFFLVREYLHVRRLNEIKSYKSIISNLRHSQSLTAADVGVIQSWMTFSYLNTLFGLPREYIKQALVISDPHYPNIVIGRYAKSQNMTSTVFVTHIRTIVSEYFSH